MYLLWKNASPNSTFNAQTVSLDLTKCIGVIVNFSQNIYSSIATDTRYIHKNTQGVLHGASDRTVDVTDSGVTVSDASNSNNNQEVPIEVIGFGIENR